jgi:hypothetical protein
MIVGLSMGGQLVDGRGGQSGMVSVEVLMGVINPSLPTVLPTPWLKSPDKCPFLEIYAYKGSRPVRDAN